MGEHVLIVILTNQQAEYCTDKLYVGQTFIVQPESLVQTEGQETVCSSACILMLQCMCAWGLNGAQPHHSTTTLLYSVRHWLECKDISSNQIKCFHIISFVGTLNLPCTKVEVTVFEFSNGSINVTCPSASLNCLVLAHSTGHPDT